MVFSTLPVNKLYANGRLTKYQMYSIKNESSKFSSQVTMDYDKFLTSRRFVVNIKSRLSRLKQKDHGVGKYSGKVAITRMLKKSKAPLQKFIDQANFFLRIKLR